MTHAYKQMVVAPTIDGGEREFGFEAYETLAAAGSTPYILIPDDVQNITVTAESTGTIVVYSTTSPVSMVKADTATWLAWGAGSVSTATGATFNPVTAIYATQSGAGASKFSVRAQ